MSVNPMVKAMIDEVYGESKIKVGAIVRHPEHGTVKIVDGQYWGDHGISNHWSWREYNTDGTLGEQLHHGYGWL